MTTPDEAAASADRLHRIRIVSLKQYRPDVPPGELIMFFCTVFAEDVIKDMRIGYEGEAVNLTSFLSERPPDAAVHMLDEPGLERLRSLAGAPAYITTFPELAVGAVFYTAAVLAADAILILHARERRRVFHVWHRAAGIVGCQGDYDDTGTIRLGDSSDLSRRLLLPIALGGVELRPHSEDLPRPWVKA